MKKNGTVLLAVALLFMAGELAAQTSLMENLGRGVVAVRTSPTDVFVGWRVLGTDDADVAFHLYRSAGGGPPVRLNAAPLSGPSHFLDTTADLAQPNAYFVRPIVFGVEQPPGAAFTLPAGAPVQQYLRVPLQVPAGGTTPAGEAYTYSPNDTSVGDLDGDGEYELVVKWDPSNAKDNSQGGYTGNVYLDAYELDGTRLWRIDLGRNIRAGAHYTQFIVYDLDGDGRAEVACRTADATIDGLGHVIGDAGADWRNAAGYVLAGPEFLTVFDGRTGAALATTGYVVPRGTVTAWGDDYGNRVDRFLAAVAYLDGRRPSLVMARGYYTRTVLAAWNWRDGALSNVWTFDTGNVGTDNAHAAWRGQGNHNLSVATSTATAATRSCTGPAPSTTTAAGSSRRASATATRCTCRTWIPTVRAWRPSSPTRTPAPTGPTPSSCATPGRARSSSACRERAISAAAWPSTSIPATAATRCGARATPAASTPPSSPLPTRSSDRAACRSRPPSPPSTSACGGTATSCASCWTGRRSANGTGWPEPPHPCWRPRASRPTTPPRPRPA